MQQSNSQVLATIIAVVVLLIVISVIVLLLTVYYTNSRRKLFNEKEVLKTTYEQTLLQLKTEVQEQTLTNISREIHDNITQVLSFVKLNLAMATGNDAEKETKIQESRELVGQAIDDLRNLAKSLSYEHIASIGLPKSLEIEVGRLNASKLLEVSLQISGNEYSLGEQRDLILFRIFQETLNNTLKYAEAQHFKIYLQYSNQLVTLLLEDDGKGFSLGEAELKGGLGLRNMKSRAALIGADLQIETSPENGCRILITLNPLTQFKHTDENDPNRAR